MNEIEVPAEKTRKRAAWGNGIEFLMSCVAMSVGLGNVWRFPFTAYENGGGAFIIPYVIVLLLIGRPVYYMEMCLGQFTGRGNVQVFESLAPVLKGVGYGQMLGSVCVATYYASLIALTFIYLIKSFTNDLPWSNCRDEWEMRSTTCVSANEVALGNNSISSSELYFRKEILKEKNQIDDGLGYPEWRLSLCLLFSWAVTFIITRRGVQSSGKASYFLALFPYVIMITLLIRAATLEGADKGMLYFINPVWSKLLEPQVWYSAVTQCFFSLNIGFGSIIMYASYNDFNYNIYRDAMIVTTLDTFTSLLCGTTIFGILGSLAHKLNVDVKDVVNAGGTGLAFISYPEAIVRFDAVPWLFAILFFFMLFVLGVGSLVGLQAVAFTVILDNFPSLPTWKVTLGTAVIGVLIGLVYLTPGGQFVLTLVDYFGGTMIFFVLTIIETTAVFWWYGLRNFCDDIEFMNKRKVGVYWRMSWGLITPIILIVIFIYFLVNIERLKHEGTDFPDAALAFGWLIVVLGIGQIIPWWWWHVHQEKKRGNLKAFKKSFSHELWGPSNKDRYVEWKRMKEERALLRKKVELGWVKDKLYLLVGKDCVE